MSKANQSKIDKAYKHIANKNPDITNKRHLELLTRKYIMRQKMSQSILFFFGGVFLTIVMSQLSSTPDNSMPITDWFASLLILVGLTFSIIGVCKFAKALHDPLTPNESKELEAYDLIEKGGRTDIDLSEFDNSTFLRYEQKKYNHASPFNKLLTLPFIKRRWVV